MAPALQPAKRARMHISTACALTCVQCTQREPGTLAKNRLVGDQRSEGVRRDSGCYCKVAEGER